MDNLLRLGFFTQAKDPEWVSTPKIVPKRPPAMFCMTIDNRSINAATVAIFWPMPDINNELSDVRRATVFISIEVCDGNWQLPMNIHSQPLEAFMKPKGVVQPTRTTQGAINSAANFQQKVEPCFKDSRDNLKVWIRDLVMFAKSEQIDLSLLRRFLVICWYNNLFIYLLKSRCFCNINQIMRAYNRCWRESHRLRKLWGTPKYKLPN